MKNWKLTPNDINVAKYIECYWFLEKESGDISYNRPKLNPDPSAHLIIANIHQKYWYGQNNIVQMGCGNHWIFPHRKTFVMDHSEPFRIIGIKFRIGALYSLAFPYFQVVLDTVEHMNINALMDDDLHYDENTLFDAVDNRNKARDILDELLRPWLSKSREDGYSELTRTILPLLDTTTSIAEIGSVLHRSQRTVERNFFRVTSLTMKQCKSMVRLDKMLNYLYTLDRSSINWADISSKFEFSDQPHLIRYLKNSIGDTPGEYIIRKDMAVDVYGDFEYI